MVGFRYGEHRIARELFGKLKERVWSENQNYWIQSLELFSQGEEVLAKQDNKCLQDKLTSVSQQEMKSVRVTCLIYCLGCYYIPAWVDLSPGR